MSNVDKIKAEIERRKKENMYVDLPMSIGRYYEDRDLLAFIDSLPEEKPMNMDEELNEEIKKEMVKLPFFIRGKDQIAFAWHFAEWQKGQMMKEVKYGVVCKNGERDEEDVWIELNPGSLPDYKDTDPIDFIIVKQDDRPRD